ncbi:MAG: SUMF1/EgtB/PvdO family nonheme iron enzyme, partial [Myxococcales bacterium]|nr:SUMF1/EgtB/PvdO family nonheme iron enzyme [Myxococcales bacterium]
DIKPGNIFLTVAHDELIVKVLDFGMAKQSLERDGSRITDPGVVVGTPAYFSREVLTSGSHAADAQADLWALAVVAYRCLSGELPFRGANVTEICRAILRRSFPKPSELEPCLSAEVDAWFDRAFAEDVSARFADAFELGTTFSALAETPPESAEVVAPPASEPAPGIGPAPYLAIGAIGVVAIVVYAGDALWTPPPMPAALDTPPPPTATATSSASATPAPAPPPALPPLKTADPAGARSEHDEILVPGGDVWAGCHDGDLACEPRDPQRVQPFYLTRHEITVFAYAACVTAGACSDRDLQLADDGTHPRAPTGQCAWRQPAHESHPLNCVSYAQAESYCRFIGARLPTENEWLLAARGPDHRRYPWGDEAASCARAVMQDDRGRACGERGSHVAGSWPEDVSPSGALDLGGNVREWTASWLDDGQTRRIIKGGSWLDDDPQALRIGTRHALAPAETSVRVGFRCARSPE